MEFFDYEPFPIDMNYSSHIKVVGVGGGGCNVVAEIHNSNITDVDLIICNTDEQALNDNVVNHKVKLGLETLGAGLDPNKGRSAARSSEKEIRQLFEGETEMVFVTSCLGGGTGTGAAPVIAQIAKDMGKLVVGVVTLPFRDEGRDFMIRATNGLNELRKYVDSTIVIDNQKIYAPYGNLTMYEAYAKVNEVLVTAVKGISDMVTKSGKMNVDMNDVKAVMTNSKTASIGIGTAKIQSGSEGITEALNKALQYPLLSDCNFSSSQGALVVMYCDDKKIPMSARRQISEHIQNFAGNPKKFKLGLYPYERNNDEVTITVVITGFNLENVPQGVMQDRTIIIDENGESYEGDEKGFKKEIKKINKDINPELFDRRRNAKPILLVEDEEDIRVLEDTPAYLRKMQRKKDDVTENSKNISTRFTIKEIGNDNVFSTNNSFLHKTQD